MSEHVLDVLIPVHDRLDWLKLCLQALDNWTTHLLRVTLIDNASEEQETRSFLSDAASLRHVHKFQYQVIRLAQNKSFSNAINAGLRATKAPNVVILNSDVIVSEGWDKIMLQELTDPKIGITGAQSNNVSGAQAMGGTIKHPGMLMFTCVAFRRELVEKVGYLDEETFDGFSCEDLDYSFRVVDAGYKLLVSQCQVFHGGSRTLAVTVGDSNSQARNNFKYQTRLVAKHGEARLKKADRESRLPKIMIASMSAEEWTRVSFAESMIHLSVAGPFTVKYGHVRRMLPNVARQAICDTAIREGFDYVLMVDDDQTPSPDLLKRLVAHAKPVTGVVVYQRHEPYLSCVFRFAKEPKDWKLHKSPSMRRKDLVESGQVVNLEGIEHTGLRKVDSIGMGAILIQTDALKQLSDWIEKHPEDARFTSDTSCKFFGDFSCIGEDLFFASLCHAAGVPIYCDTDLVVPHLGGPVVVDEQHKKNYLAGVAKIQGSPSISYR